HIEMYLLQLAKHGPACVYAGLFLRRRAIAQGFFPRPLTAGFLADLAWNASSRHWRPKAIRVVADRFFDRTKFRVEQPSTECSYHYIVDALLASHGIVPLPPEPKAPPHPLDA